MLYLLTSKSLSTTDTWHFMNPT